jgi:hypothetical protein
MPHSARRGAKAERSLLPRTPNTSPQVVWFWGHDALAQMLLRLLHLALAGRMADVPDR